MPIPKTTMLLIIWYSWMQLFDETLLNVTGVLGRGVDCGNDS